MVEWSVRSAPPKTVSQSIGQETRILEKEGSDAQAPRKEDGVNVKADEVLFEQDLQGKCGQKIAAAEYKGK